MKSHLKSTLLAAAFFLPFSGGAAFAAPDAIGVTFDSTITVPEDGEKTTLDYTLTNDTTGAITFGGAFGIGFVRQPGVPPPGVTIGDASDRFNFGSDILSDVSLGTCSTLAPGDTCTAHVSFFVDDGTGETDGDSGATTFFVEFITTSGLSTGGLDTTVTVTDPVITPLPAALPLFGTGLGALGLLGWRRKRKARPAVA